MTIVGLINPGEMGASIGAAAMGTADKSLTEVIWAGEGRSPASHQRAEKAGIRDCGSLSMLCKTSDIILSVCPPHNAAQVAGAVLDSGFNGLFADCNAISPGSCRKIAAGFNAPSFVDGGIVGGPAWTYEAGTTLYLSGESAAVISALFDESPLNTIVISSEIGAASAMKMAFAAYTKGATALLAGVLGVADHYGVRGTLENQWGETFTKQTHQRLTNNSVKAWRFAGEMREIAETFAEAGFPPGFHEAAAETFERLAAFKDNPATNIEALLTALDEEQP